MDIQGVIDRLRERTHMPLFVVEVWDTRVDQALRETRVEELFGGREIRDPHMAAAALAGLHLWNDNFTGSHNLCQGIDTPTGSYWHGLCHRREGHRGEGLQSNLGNAKYWFRRVGEHPAFEPVYRSALTVLEQSGTGFRWATEAASQLHALHHWDPSRVIDWFGQCDAGVLSPQTQALLEEIQWREIDILVDWCVEKALES